MASSDSIHPSIQPAQSANFSDPDRHDKRQRIFLLIAISAFLSMIFLDQSGVAVTLPRMQLALGLTNVDVQWVMNAFLLTLSVLLLFCGRLSDYFGYRRMFVLGMWIFLLASVVCAIAQNNWQIILGRSLQGVGGSLALATYLVLISRRFPITERGKALGTSAAFGSLFLSNGPLIGGFFSQVISWRWIFWINIPIALVCIYFTLNAVPRDEKSTHSEVFDILGLLVFIVAMTSLVVVLLEGPVFGWSSMTIITLFITSVIAFIVFGIIELNVKAPLLQLSLFKNKIFLAGNVILFTTQVCAIVVVFWALWLQYSHGYSPLMAGLALLPAGLPYIIASRLGGGWIDRSGPRAPICTGTALLLIGTIWVALTALTNNYFWLVWGMVIYGCGWGLVIPCSILAVMGSVEAHHHSTASGVLNTMRQVGGSLGLAVVGAVITSYDNAKISDYLASSAQYVSVNVHEVQKLLAGATAHLVQMSTAQIQTLKGAAQLFYTHAFTVGMLVSGIFALIGYIFAARFLTAQTKIASREHALME